MTNDGVNTLTYDAENRVVSSSGGGGSADYAYDAAGLRVRKCAPNCTNPTTTTVYVFSGTKVIAEYVNGSLNKEYIYSGSVLVATHDAGTLKYHHNDHLSMRVTTNTSGSIVAQSGHFPYGENWYESGGANKLKFTSYERDAESGNDYAVMRYHVNRLGRFSAPDPIAGRITDPQSLNRYTYSRNNPVNLIDPLGLDFVAIQNNNMGVARWGFNQFDAARVAGGGGGDFMGFGWEGLWYDNATGGWGFDVAAIPSWREREEAERKLYEYYKSNEPMSQGSGDKQKKKLLDLLRKALNNPECAALLGGNERAGQLLQSIGNFVDITDSAYHPRSSAEQEAVENLRNRKSLAAVKFETDLFGEWNGLGSIDFLVGSLFNGVSQSAQVTIIIHELIHVSGPRAFASFMLHGPNNRNVRISTDIIMERCKTADPIPKN